LIVDLHACMPKFAPGRTAGVGTGRPTWQTHFTCYNAERFFFFQQPDSAAKTHKAFATMDFDMELGGQFSLSDRDSA